MKGDATIKGVMPTRGTYLVHINRVKTYGRVVRVCSPEFEKQNDKDAGEIIDVLIRSVRVVWWSNTTGGEVESDPENLRWDGHEWSDAPLPDYIVKHEFPYLGKHPEISTMRLDDEHCFEAALAHAEKGDPVRAAALYKYVGHEEAAGIASRLEPRWR